MTPDPVTAEWLRALLLRHDITQREAADLLRVELRSVQRWLAGDRACAWHAAELLRRLLAEQSGKAALWR